MEREITSFLQQWQQKKYRKPLIIKGVRQCGKTYSLKEFGESNFPNVHIINFERTALAKSIFDDDLDPAVIISKLNFLLDKEINVETDLVIFDEIQECPKAITSLKYFFEQMPQLTLCSAGSLLGLELSPSSFPVGKVDFVTMYPMSFHEFLNVIDGTKLLNYLKKININVPITEVVHVKAFTYFKWYCITGGMPEIVQIFAENKENLFDAFTKVRARQSDLINGYYADIAKHTNNVNAIHVEKVFTSIPSQLVKGKNAKASKFKFQEIEAGTDRYEKLSNAFDWLDKAGLIIKVPIVRAAEYPLASIAKQNVFKLYCFDIGILGAMANVMPGAILEYDYGNFKGFIAENFIGQSLTYLSNQVLYSWVYDRSEIEFLMEKNGSIIPLEVKAGKSFNTKSLNKYEDRYAPEKAIVFSALSNYNKENKRINCPLYLIELVYENI